MPYSADFKIKAFPFFCLLRCKAPVAVQQTVLFPQFSVLADPVIDFKKSSIVYKKQKKLAATENMAKLAVCRRNKEYVVHDINTRQQESGRIIKKNISAVFQNNDCPVCSGL